MHQRLSPKQFLTKSKTIPKSTNPLCTINFEIKVLVVVFEFLYPYTLQTEAKNLTQNLKLKTIYITGL